MSDEIKIVVNVGTIQKMFDDSLSNILKSSIEKHKVSIEKDLDDVFGKTSIFDNKNTLFSNALDYAVEKTFQESLTKTLDDLGLVCANCHRKVHAGLINLNDYITNESPLCTTGEGVTE